MLFVQPARPCQRWVVASWLVQVRRSAVCQRWLAAFVMVELRCSVVFVGMVVSGCGVPFNAVPVSTRARPAGLVLAGLRVVCLRSCGGCSCGVVGAQLSRPAHGRLGLCGFCCAAASGIIVKSCLCSRHIRVGAG